MEGLARKVDSGQAEGVPRLGIVALNPRLEETDRMMQGVRIMDAAQIIREISRLPDEEKGKVVEFVRNLPESSEAQARFADRKSFEKAAESVFSKHSKLFEELAK